MRQQMLFEESGERKRKKKIKEEEKVRKAIDGKE